MYPKIIVGNEAIMNGWATGDELASKIESVRSQLQAAGYDGPVLTAEPVSSYQENPQICDAVDLIGINAHSYFAPTYYAYQAGEFVQGQVSQAQGVCTGKTAYVTETGYPSQGDVNGNNVPSPDNQMTAVYSILEALDGDVTLLTTFDDFWKEPGPYGVEQYFGAAWFLE
jgi:exo-beta-1,3-glucanase (GH17 family)